MNRITNSAPLENCSEKFSNLHLVADLEYFEGPLLSLYRDDAGKNYLYHWCDVNETHNRWLVVPCSNRAIERFVRTEVTLLELINKPSEPFVYCVDINGEGSYDNVWLMSPKYIPENYLPDTDVVYDAEPMVEENDIYNIPIDGEWDFYELRRFPMRINQISGALWAARTSDFLIDGRNLHGNGFSYMHYYNSLTSKIPSDKKAQLQSIMYASPGSIQIKAEPRLITEMKNLFQHYRKNRSETCSEQRRISNLLAKAEVKNVKDLPEDCVLTEDNLKDYIKVLSTLLGLDKKKLKKVTHKLITVKTLLWLIRRLEDLFWEFEDKNRAFFSNL
jgi:hypothetical protein